MKKIGKRWGQWLCFAVAAFLPAAAMASDLEDLARAGYAVVGQTNVSGSFDGCDFDKHLELDNGLVFVCMTYHYHYAYHPEVLILQHIKTGDLKVIIDEDEYSGRLVKRSK